MNPSTHPKCFFSGASSITKSEPTGKPAGPHDLAFDEFGNGERGAKFFAAREALAGCRGAALTRRFCCAAACGGITKHILSLRLGSETTFDELAITSSNRLALLRKKSRNRRWGVRFEISAH